MNKEQLVALAKRTIDKRRSDAQLKCEKTLEKLRSCADWRICEKALKTAQVNFTLGGDASAKDEIAKQKTVQKQLLAKYGLTSKDIVPNYHCRKCQDTGYVGGKICSCLQEELRKLLAKQSNVANNNYTFENSKEKNKHNLAVAKKAQQVCADNKMKNILLTGGTGTGKTYLLSACVNRCAQLGKSVLFVTAYNLNSLFLESHLSDLETKQAILQNLTDVDVLAIDDLGTENVYNNVTAEYLFALLNERITLGKQTFISTNLTLADIRERYDERIFSRMVDQNITFVALLEGADKRINK